MLNQEDYETIQITKEDGIAVLTLNRPERLNAVNSTMHSELAGIFSEIDSDPDVRVAVLTGAGRGFCSGGDFGPGRNANAERDSGLTMMQEARRIVDSMLDMEKPIIAAVNGAAVGLGATIALFCDVVIAARNARFGDTHVKMGITAGDGGAVIWPLLVGVNRAKQLLMTGDLISAEKAGELGLVSEVTDEGEALNEAMLLARRLADGPPYAIQSTKISVNKLIKSLSNLVLPLSLALEEVSMTKEDHREAVKAFQEKREPKFTGS
ncbi:MAG TPA: enoyl-CoA hydratase-related protein [Pseudomonadales bacterium]|jgi:enoyl-CoA hydratase|nr:enoyl-CoA hydratase [Gammaproteobacteria bacterium]MDP6027124.1 enoyl-CoA hydratase-related protein [Pseudomonadales bacterium]MDP6314598.1 enoyl-CoA hydratase-related protein [Pseudomonadales bacterium]MDP7313421.1 enoyl-CoA hydratase-related protein [Pseudomonadales bacterium]HJP52055.1 enoyl-CoA hydratase-related protein [Pseudomonadales bacterium]